MQDRLHLFEVIIMTALFPILASLLNLAGPDLLIIFFIFGISIPFVIWMIVDCALYESDQNNLKLVWVLVILFAPAGSLIYLFARKLQRSTPPQLPR
jgi:hypothetical protein